MDGISVMVVLLLGVACFSKDPDRHACCGCAAS
jgi:hypothetical protein